VSISRKFAFFIILFLLLSLLVASSIIWRSSFNGVIQIQVLGITNIEGSACLVLEEPYPGRSL
jgi:hypothetical protein